MGRDVPAITISPQDRRAYREKVRKCLDVFARMLRESRFDAEPRQVGLEIELNLADELGRPALTNDRVLASIADPAWATELGQFNLEINIPPRPLAGDALSALEREIRASLNHAEQRAAQCQSHLVMIGMLPTLREADVGGHAMSPNPRYRLLNEQVLAARGEEMHIRIEGTEQLAAYVDTITPEAACTSVQLHLQVSPELFASYWNAAQAIAGVQVALAANSPFLFGRELWQETRITLVFDLFEENLRYFPPLLPLQESEDPQATLDRGEAPQLGELTLHNGTIYRWNRPVYAVVDGRPHLRVENRVLPAGPTVADIMANAAFYYGLVRALAEEERPVWTRMSFSAAAENLASGARHGAEARVYWPGMGEVEVTELTLRRLLPLAARGLERWGVAGDDARRMLSVIEQRCLTGATGASWQCAAAGQRTSGRAGRGATADDPGLHPAHAHQRPRARLAALS